ncbi:MAG: hypothetical protein GY809_29730, partial [Planctomycetes bacterium]|nr:hypothetical protein [Planctomycetota bacterium]
MRNKAMPQTPWVRTKEGHCSSLPHLAVQMEAAKWKSIWTSMDDPDAIADLAKAANAQELQPLTAEEIAKAAAAFKLRTTAGEGIHPRQIADLCRPGQKDLAHLLTQAEQAGNFPVALRSMLVRLLGKGTMPETFRCILLYRTLYRIWAKARQPLARAWARQQVRGLINNEEGRRITDAMWRGLVRRTGHINRGCRAQAHSAEA